MSVVYHPGKTNVVADALSRMTMGSVYHVEEGKKELVKNFHRLYRLEVRLEDFPNDGFMVHNKPESSLVVEVKSKKHLDPLLMELKKSVINKFNDYSTRGNGFLRYRDLREVYWWDDLKRDIAEFVSKCPNFQQVKAEHLKPTGLIQEMGVPT
ncbi:uncharacterized protein [Solanum lycopersicum]|uniref:uncharacterized protein n=1 Tax=Solanum lycopersicum TaxID=4081 RepID=UPI003749D9B0